MTDASEFLPLGPKSEVELSGKEKGKEVHVKTTRWQKNSAPVSERLIDILAASRCTGSKF